MPSPRVLTAGELPRRYRHAAGLTQEELAERAAVSARSISDIERGISLAPHRGTLDAMVDALGLSTEERELLQVSVRARRGLGGGEAIPAIESHESIDGAGSRWRTSTHRARPHLVQMAAQAARAPGPLRFLVVLALIALAAGITFMITRWTSPPASISAAQAFTPWELTQDKPAGMEFATGLATDDRGNLYASTSSIDPRAGGVWKLAPSGKVQTPAGMVTDQQGRVIVSGAVLAIVASLMRSSPDELYGPWTRW